MRRTFAVVMTALMTLAALGGLPSAARAASAVETLCNPSWPSALEPLPSGPTPVTVSGSVLGAGADSGPWTITMSAGNSGVETFTSGGLFSLLVPANDTYALTINHQWSTTLTVGSVDASVGAIQLPSPVTSSVHVQDQLGAPYIGERVAYILDGALSLSPTLPPFTTPVQPALAVTIGWTDASGNVVFPGIYTAAGVTVVVITCAGGVLDFGIGTPGDSFTFPADTDGVSAGVEFGAPNGGDGNSDGILDAKQANVASLPSPSGEYLTVASGPGTSLNAVTVVDPATVAAPPPLGYVLPSGLAGFTLNGIPSGSTQAITVFTPSALGALGYAKYDDTTQTWTALPAGRVTVLPDRVVISLTDGGVGDDDGVANGSITDPGGVYLRDAYAWSGFAQPINDTAHQAGMGLSVFKAGSTVPVKFALTDSSGQVVRPLAAPRWLTPVSGGPSALAIDEAVYALPADSGDVYRSAGGGWIYNWKTTKDMAGKTWRIGVRLDDGQEHVVLIALR